MLQNIIGSRQNMRDTTAEYNQAIKQCKELFLKKAKDYGTAWSIIRLSSITDQLFIKAQRIRTLEVTGVAKVNEGIPSEFTAIVNYCVIALLQIELGEGSNEDINLKQLEESYDKKV